MTTTAVPPVEAAPKVVERDPLRLLSISANLLPIEITDARRANKLRWFVAAALVIVLALLAVWDVQARRQTSDAKSDLGAAQSRVQALQGQQKQYADLSNTKASSAAIEAELTKLMGQDLKWFVLVPALRNAATASGVTVSDFSAVLTPTTGATPTTTTTSSINPATVGTISITGSSPDKPSVAAFLDSLAKVPGLVNPYLISVTTQGPGNQYTVQVGFTSALYQGRYTPAAK
jgi:hypothetical protein